MSDTSVRKLYIVRHGHRDKDQGHLYDNGLSPKGKAQAKALVPLLKPALQGHDVKFLSSPRKRCVETLQPIARALKRGVSIDELLTEQEPDEGSSALDTRVVKFLKEWNKSNDPLWVICSHGDWIPLALEWLLERPISLKKAGWIEITFPNGKPKMGELVQDVLLMRS